MGGLDHAAQQPRRDDFDEHGIRFTIARYHRCISEELETAFCQLGMQKLEHLWWGKTARMSICEALA